MFAVETGPPEEVLRLFWDVDPETIDIDRHRDYVIGRVMTRGGWEAMCWLRRAYANHALTDYLQRHGVRTLPPRELAYWALMTGLDVPIPRGGGRPAWAG